MTAFFSAFSSSKLEKYPKKRGWSEKLNTFPYIRIQVKEGDKRSVFMVKYMLIIGYQKEIIFCRLQNYVSHFNLNGEQYQKLKKGNVAEIAWTGRK